MMTVAVARTYFAVQAAIGAVWWLLVFVSDDVRRLTLGGWNPGLLVVPDVACFVLGSLWIAVTASRSAAMIVAFWTVGITAALTAYGLIAQAAGWGVAAMLVASTGTVAATLTLWFGRLPTSWFFRGPFAFRQASAGSSARHVVRSLTQLVVFWTTFFVAVPLTAVSVERRLGLSMPVLERGLSNPAGWALFAAGSAVGLWSCVTMAWVGQGTPLPAETARLLVIRGPYAWVRNPMAVAGAVQSVGIGLVLGSWIVVALAVAGAVAWNVLIRPVEEADLRLRFGDDYEQYCHEVRCWIPARAS